MTRISLETKPHRKNVPLQWNLGWIYFVTGHQWLY